MKRVDESAPEAGGERLKRVVWVSEHCSNRESYSIGPLFKSYSLQHLSAYADLLPVNSSILYWRTVRGEEVDFVIETPTRLLPIEVKTSRTLGKRDLRGLTAFLKEYAETTPIAVVLYGGREWLRPARNVIAIPWSAFLGN